MILLGRPDFPLGRSADPHVIFAASRDVFELLDDEGQFITLLSMSATPEVTAVAYKLYGQGLNRGLRAGEELAWSKLRHLIGAVAIER